MIKKLFLKLKKNFTKKNSVKTKRFSTAQEVSFTDLAGKSLVLEIRSNGNETLIAITDKKHQTEFLLDRELAVLLNVLIQSYTVHEVFPNLDEE